MVDEATTEVTAEIQTPPASPEDRARTEIQHMGNSILTIADQIIAENRLSTEPTGVNLAWTIHGDNSQAARTLKEATKGWIGNAMMGMGAHLQGIDLEPGLHNYGNTKEKVAHHLALDFVHRLGFIDEGQPADLRSLYDRRKNAVVFPHPTKPFDMECQVNGRTEDGEPSLAGFTVRYRSP